MKRFQLLVITVGLLVAACGGRTAAAPTAQPPVVRVTPGPIVDPPFEASGVITFGTAFDPDTLEITTPKSSFKRNVKKIAWSASLSDVAGATSLTIILASHSKSGVEETLVRTEVDIANPDFAILANAIDLASLVDNKAGTYVMRYLREATVLAEGMFTLTK